MGALLLSQALVRWPLQRKVSHTLLWAVGMIGLATVVFGLSHSLMLSRVTLATTGAPDRISVQT